jgi:hypothetical protein
MKLEHSLNLSPTVCIAITPPKDPTDEPTVEFYIHPRQVAQALILLAALNPTLEAALHLVASKLSRHQPN